MIRYTLALFVLLFASTANAADVFCGWDTDRSGTASNACPEPDKDHDGYPSSNAYNGPYGNGVVDCDDNDPFMYVGMWDTAGCSAGQYRTCQSDGTYSSCSAISGLTCSSGSGNTYWANEGGQTGSACATGSSGHTTPCGEFCFSDSSLGCYHAPAAGDCIVFKDDGGAYSGTWSDGGTVRQFYFNNKDGTLANPITFRVEPGTRPVFNGAGTSPTEVLFFRAEDSDYIKWIGGEFDGTSDYTGTAFSFGGGTFPEVSNVDVHHVRGFDDNNMGCFKTQTTVAGGASFHHFMCRDVYDSNDPADQNSGSVTIMDTAGAVDVSYGVIISSTQNGFCARVKHQEPTGVATFRGLFCQNAEYAFATEQQDTVFKNNWAKDLVNYALRLQYIGSDECEFTGNTWNYNTIENAAGFIMNSCLAECIDGSQSFGSSVLVASNNIIVDDDASYGADRSDGFLRIFEYCLDTERTASSGKFTFSGNVYYNPNDTLEFGEYAGSGSPAGDYDDGNAYSGLAAWQAAGFDSGTVDANPSLDADGISATYPTKGWRANEFSAAAGTTQGSGGRGKRPNRGRFQ